MIEFTTWHWLAFGVLVSALLAIDLGLFHRKSRETSIREAALSTAAWCCLALAFNGYVWWAAGPQAGRNFLAGYLVEWALSMDNVFVFAVIFTYFRVPLKYQYRVLFWGIIGAVVLRLAFILVGAELIDLWFVIWVMGAFLIYTGAKLAFHDEEFEPEKSLVIKVARRLFRVSREPHGQKFFVREGGQLCITPLFLVLLVIDFVDVAFALDSVPAIFGVVTVTDHATRNFIVFTSNIFAILGLRALYFLLAGAMEMFRYLRYGLSAILVFVGAKFLIGNWYKLPDWLSLAVIAMFLALSIGASLIASKRERRLEGPLDQGAEPLAFGEEQPSVSADNGQATAPSEVASDAVDRK
ncbi:MAG TPA: TerC family protein [Pirellulales bacterium]|nr:TerC family protein [Pirellulales bacterium]